MIGFFIIALLSFFCIYFTYRHDLSSFKFLIVYSVFQNFFLVLISKYISDIQFTVIVLLKEVMMDSIILIGIIRNSRNYNNFDWFCVGSILFLFAMLILPGGNVQQKVTSLRQLYLPFAFYLFGRNSFVDKDKLKKGLIFFVKIMFICSLFGVIELSYGDGFWDALGYKYFSLHKYGTFYLYNGYVINNAMYSYDFFELIGRPFLRECSFLVDSVIYGQLLAFALICLFTLKKSIFKHYRLIFAFMLIHFFLTLTKGGTLILVLWLFIIILNKLALKINKDVKLLVLIFAVIAALVITYPFLSTVRIHLDGLLSNISPGNPFGNGLGTAGNLAELYGDTSSNGESFIGASLGQIGFLTILYFCFFGKLYFRLGIGKNDKIGAMLSTILMALFLSSFLNNTSISFTSAFIYIIPSGMCSGNFIKKSIFRKNYKTIAS